MLLQTFSEPMESACYQSRWMIIYSSACHVNTSTHIMPGDRSGMQLSHRMEDKYNQVVDSGTGAKLYPMVSLPSSMKIHQLTYWTSPCIRTEHQVTKNFHILIRILTSYLNYWAYPGKDRKPFPSWKLLYIWVSNGTLLHAWYQFQPTKRRNTNLLLKHGKRTHSTPWRKPKNYMESYYMSATSYQRGTLTSPVWRPSWALSPQILSLHTILLNTQLQTSTGDSINSTQSVYHIPSQAPRQSQTGEPSQMQVQVLASALLSAANGGLGGSSQVGSQKVETLAGQKQLDSNSWHNHSALSAPQANTLKSSEIIEGLSKVDGLAEAGILRQIRSSDASTASQMLMDAILSLNMLPVARTQLMRPPEEFTLQLLTSSQLLTSLPRSRISSSISTTNSYFLNPDLILLAPLPGSSIKCTRRIPHSNPNHKSDPVKFISACGIQVNEFIQ